MPMNDRLGYSFAPTFENAQMARGGRAPGASPQGAIETLNFRLPKVTGEASLSPLVSQTPRGTSFGGSVLQSVLRSVLGSDASAMFGGGMDGGGGGGGMANDPGSAVLMQLLSGASTQNSPLFASVSPGQQTGEGPLQNIPLPPSFRAPVFELPQQPSRGATPAFDYGSFDRDAYQQYQTSNPDAPISPYEFQTGERYSR